MSIQRYLASKNNAAPKWNGKAVNMRNRREAWEGAITTPLWAPPDR